MGESSFFVIGEGRNVSACVVYRRGRTTMLFENDCPSLMHEQTVAVRVCVIDDLGVSNDSGVSDIRGIANGNAAGTNCAEPVLENKTISDW